MELSTEEIGDITVVEVLTEVLDAGNTDEFKTGFASILNESKKIVFEMSHVKFIDSSGCGTLLFCQKQLSKLGGNLKLCGVQESVHSLFELVRMDRVIDIFDSKEEAIKSFQ
ncbi:MAG: STAS domain-containing protein [Desulfobacteraceae bacterium]|nr:STAS domain-containing protein [Pseudomonadota bacterium]MBU4463372.1 STAS domain-containing protein [Pseudomonadota bacterium]MCG2755710.1 STAS domain-containing protein [Desulfobacteraceae bacterium]